MNKYTKRTLKYIKQYEWSNVFAMLRNNKRAPLICDDSFNDKWVAITGATSGIGYHTAIKYASKGANIICINRNKEKTLALCKEIQDNYGVSCKYFLADLSQLEETHRLADNLAKLDIPIDIFIHNAGIYLTKKEANKEGIEKVFMVNYLSSFIINYKLLTKLKQQSSARIIYVNSEGYRFAAWGLRTDDLNWNKRKYSGLKSYGAAKLAQILTMHIFNRKIESSGVTINAMHPGAVKSNTGNENGKKYKWFKNNVLEKKLKDTDISAEAIYYLGVSKDIANITDTFFNLTQIEELTPPALDMEVAEELWNESLTLAKLI